MSAELPDLDSIMLPPPIGGERLGEEVTDDLRHRSQPDCAMLRKMCDWYGRFHRASPPHPASPLAGERSMSRSAVLNAFTYNADGDMLAEGVALKTIAQQVGTPFYCYSAAALRAGWQEFADGMKGMNASLCYALKANSNLAVVKLFGDLGVGADIVSVGEMRRALAAGIPGRKIVYSGVGKKPSELMAALEAGIGQINVESSAELETLNSVAGQLGVKADITIRVNPDIDAGTHEKDHDRAQGEQVRHRHRPRARCLRWPAACPTSRWWAWRCISARSSRRWTRIATPSPRCAS